MLAYAASRPKIGARCSSPNAMLIVISVHVAALAVLMSAKMDLPQRIRDHRTEVTFVPIPQPPPPNPPVRQPQPHQQAFTRPDIALPIPLPDPQSINLVPQQQIVTDPWPTTSVDPGPRIAPPPLAVRTGARLLTPASELKPPYPQSKLLAEEEATLKLRLTIDERGRVVAVEPVGRADATFLDAARRYLIAHWRYRPASEGGRAIASSEVITLRFQLDG
jgi:protein TonB